MRWEDVAIFDAPQEAQKPLSWEDVAVFDEPTTQDNIVRDTDKGNLLTRSLGAVGKSFLDTEVGKGIDRGVQNLGLGIAQLGAKAGVNRERLPYLEEEAARLRQEGKDAPWYGDVAELGTGLLAGGVGAGLAGQAIKGVAPVAAQAYQGLSNARKLATVGAATGAASGLFTPTVEDESTLGNVAIGTAIGAVAPKAFDVVGKGIRQAPNSIKNYALDTTGFLGKAALKSGEAILDLGNKLQGSLQDSITLTKSQRVLPDAQKTFVRMLQRGGIDLDAALSKIEAAKAQGLSLPLYEAVDDPVFKRAGKMLLQASEASKRAADANEVIQGKVPDAIKDLALRLGRTNADPEKAGIALAEVSEEIINKAKETLRTRAKPWYDKALSPDKLVNTDIIDNPYIKDVIAGVRSNKLIADEISGMADNSLPVLHKVQQELADAATSQARKGNNYEAKRIRDFRNGLMEKMGDLVPEYKIATRIYADDITVLEDLNKGPLGTFLKAVGGDSAEAVDSLLDLSKTQLGELKALMHQAGYKDKFEEIASSNILRMYGNIIEGRFGTFSNKIKGKPEQLSRLRIMVGKEKAESIETFFDSLDRVVSSQSIKGGSDTAPNISFVQSLKGGGQEALEFISNPAKKLFQVYNDTILDDPNGAEKLVRYLFTDDGVRMVKKLAKEGNLKGKSIQLEKVLNRSAQAGAGYVGYKTLVGGGE